MLGQACQGDPEHPTHTSLLCQLVSLNRNWMLNYQSIIRTLPFWLLQSDWTGSETSHSNLGSEMRYTSQCITNRKVEQCGRLLRTVIAWI